MFIAREINQPLTAILANANAFSRLVVPLKSRRSARANDSLGEVRAALDEIGRDGIRAGDLIGAIRSQFEQQLSGRELVDLNGVIQRVLSLAHPELVCHDVVVRTEFYPGLLSVVGDPIRLQTVVYNIVANAIEALQTQPGQAQARQAQAADGWL